MNPDKPQGKSGSIRLGPDGATWDVSVLAVSKAEREREIAALFISAFERGNVTQSLPSLAPFEKVVQNSENDLDFTVQTSQGQFLMELVEFAPLDAHGPSFVDAPAAMHQQEKSVLAFALISKKSHRQGGSGRFLVIYATEYGFSLDFITIELIRRLCRDNPPKFDRVYYVSMPMAGQSSVTEVYPGVPHFAFGDHESEHLKNMRLIVPHIEELVATSGIDEAGNSYISIPVNSVRGSFTPSIFRKI